MKKIFIEHIILDYYTPVPKPPGMKVIGDISLINPKVRVGLMGDNFIYCIYTMEIKWEILC